MMYEMWLQLRGEAGRAPDQESEARPDPQPRRRAGTLRELRLDRRRLKADLANKFAATKGTKSPCGDSPPRIEVPTSVG